MAVLLTGFNYRHIHIQSVQECDATQMPLNTTAGNKKINLQTKTRQNFVLITNKKLRSFRFAVLMKHQS